MHENPHDPLPGLCADVDQALASWCTLVPSLHAQFSASVEAGFSEDHAMVLLLSMLRSWQ